MTRFLTIAILIVLALYALADLFAYPLADDVAFIALAKQTNPLLQQYYGWRGSYSFAIMNGFILPLAPNIIVKVFPALLIMLMVAGLYKLFKGRVSNPLMASSGLMLAFLTALPNVWQSFMWYSASSNYVFPIALSTWLLLWLMH